MRQPPRCHSAGLAAAGRKGSRLLAVPNLGPHPPFLAADLPPAFSRLLASHTLLRKTLRRFALVPQDRATGWHPATPPRYAAAGLRMPVSRHTVPSSGSQTEPSIPESSGPGQQVALQPAVFPPTMPSEGTGMKVVRRPDRPHSVPAPIPARRGGRLDPRREDGGAQSSSRFQPSASAMAWRMRISRTLGSYGLRTK